MLWRTGDGKSARIYEDNWLLGDRPSKTLSPRAEILDVTIVSYLIDSGSGWWDTNRIDQLFLPFEAQKIGPYHCG